MKEQPAFAVRLPSPERAANPSERPGGTGPRRRQLEHFLYRFDKDPALQARFIADPAAVLAGEPMAPEEKEALARRDVVTLLRWDIHPLLIRNYAGTLKVDYVSAYRAAGLDTSPPWPDAGDGKSEKRKGGS